MSFATSSISIECDRSFKADYEARAVGSIVGLDDYVFVPLTPRLMIEVQANAETRQIGVCGNAGQRFLDALHTTPDPQTLCVVSGGTGYFLDSTDPYAWTRVAGDPISYVAAFAERRLLVLGDDTHLLAYAYDPEPIDIHLQLAWRTEALAWDLLEVKRVEGSTIVGVGWHAPTGEMREFAVSLDDGTHVGGAY